MMIKARKRIPSHIGFILFSLFTLHFSLSFSQPKNVILMIGDGMGLAQAYSAYTVNHGRLNIFTMPFTGFSKTYCADKYVTDSGAGATALAIGHKANYQSIGLDSLGNPHPSLIKLAKRKGLSTSIITTCDLTHATPAAFVANVKNRKEAEKIALAYLEKNVDIFVGGGLDNFLSTKRKDKLSLTDSLVKSGYNMIYSLDNISQINNKTAAIMFPSHPPRARQRKDMLCLSLAKTLDVLDKEDKGFFMMLEGSQIDFEAHLNKFDNMVDEILDFDKAVGLAIEFAKRDGNTLVIVIADHETGGLTLNDGSIPNAEVKDKWSSLNHTGVMVPIYAFGKGAENFTGVMENTDVFEKIKRLLNL